jgi:crotonobetainyl-CoA:carnitine CoA-transferase CaiB-like acyl-CoA transferase
VGPLTGLKVIEFAHVMAGPTCGLMLADMGADVIKVERVPDGEDTRRMTPPTIDGEAAAFLMMNRNKRGIAVDLKREAGKAVARRLLRTADVTIENFRKGTMERLGLGYDAIRKENPGLIFCEVSGFGRTGPYADRGGYDLIAQGMSGLMSITGEAPGRPPVKCGAPMTDITAGILAAMGVLAAYAHKLKTGEGQRVDVSLFEAGIVHTYWQSAITFATGKAPGPMGSAHPLNAPYQAFEAADGWITIGAANQPNWLKLIDALEASVLKDDPRFATNDARMVNLPALVEVLTPLFKKRSSADWLKRLEAVGVPAGPVLDIAQMHADPQTLARQMVVEVPHSRLKKHKTLGAPVKFSVTRSAVERGAPVLGEHTREILTEYGYAKKAIDDLIDSGAVIAA